MEDAAIVPRENCEQDEGAQVDCESDMYPLLAAQFVSNIRPDKWICRHCDASFIVKSISRARSHFDDSDKHIATCAKCPKLTRDAIMKEFFTNAKRRKRNDQPSRQPSIASKFIPAQRATQDSFEHALAMYIVRTNTAFRAVEDPWLLKMLQIARALPELPAMPSRKKLSDSILNRVADDSIQSMATNFQQQSKRFGYTLAIDGWSTRHNVDYINFIKSSNGVDMFSEAKSGVAFKKKVDMVALLSEHIRAGGKEIVQLVVDGAVVCTFPTLSASFPDVFLTWCGAHSLDLLLEDIAKHTDVRMIIDVASSLVKFIMNHKAVLDIFKKHSQGMILLRPGLTRFATHFISMQRVHRLQGAILSTFSSPEYRAWLPTQETTVRQAASQISPLLSVNWFQRIESLLDLMEPVVMLLRDVDGCAIGWAGKIYYRMYLLQEFFADAQHYCNFSPTLQEHVQSVFRIRWDKMHARIHTVGFMLDPEFQDVTDFEQTSDDAFMREWHEIVAAQFPGKSVDDQLAMFHDRKGSFAQAPRGMKNALQYWTYYGASAPDLQHLAMRVFAQPVSSSAAERNWSLFAWTLGLRRQRLGPAKLSSMISIQVSEALLARSQHAADVPAWISEDIEILDSETMSLLTDEQLREDPTPEDFE
jgi:hypothetical protein